MNFYEDMNQRIYVHMRYELMVNVIFTMYVSEYKKFNKIMYTLNNIYLVYINTYTHTFAQSLLTQI